MTTSFLPSPKKLKASQICTPAPQSDLIQTFTDRPQHSITDQTWSRFRSHVLLVSADIQNIHTSHGSICGTVVNTNLLGYYDRLYPDFCTAGQDSLLPDVEFSLKENALTSSLHNGSALLTLLPHRTAYGDFRVPLKVLQGLNRLSTSFVRSIVTYCLNYENKSLEDLEDSLIFAFDRWIDIGQNGVIFHSSKSTHGIHRFFKSNRSSFCRPFLRYAKPGTTPWTASLESILEIRDSLLELVSLTNGTPTPEQLCAAQPSLHKTLLSNALPEWGSSAFHLDLEQLIVEFDDRL